MARADAPPVAVLVVTRDRRAEVLATLQALAALDYPRDRLAVLVLDNGSRDGTAAAVEEWLAGCPSRGWGRAGCLRAGENLGAAAARNRLAGEAAGSAYYLFLDDDAVPDPGFLGAATAAARDPAIGVVGGRVVAFEEPARELSGAGFVDWRLGRFRDEPAAAPTECDFVSSCAALVRADAFRAAGGFDEDYFVYHEDVDFCVRVRRQGFRILHEPAAVARHRVPAGKRHTPERLYYLIRNKFLFLRKHLPWRRHPLPWLLHGLGLLPVTAAGAARSAGQLRAILAGGLDGVRGRTGRWRG